MRLVYSGCTEVGAVRKINEDSILMCSSSEAGLFLVADGIGGKDHGEIASGMLRDRYRIWWNHSFLPSAGTAHFPESVEAIKQVLLETNREMVQRFGEWNGGSTLVLLFLLRDHCAYISSGDSRIYRMRRFSVKQITKDDVYENMHTEGDIRYDASFKGKLVGAVGIHHNLDFSIHTDKVRSGDRYFLCSDGVYRYVPQQTLHRRLCCDSLLFTPNRVTLSLKKEVERNGVRDNYSMILVKA